MPRTMTKSKFPPIPKKAARNPPPVMTSAYDDENVISAPPPPPPYAYYNNKATTTTTPKTQLVTFDFLQPRYTKIILSVCAIIFVLCMGFGIVELMIYHKHRMSTSPLGGGASSSELFTSSSPTVQPTLPIITTTTTTTTTQIGPPTTTTTTTTTTEYPTTPPENTDDTETSTIPESPCKQVAGRTYLTSSSKYHRWGNLKVPIPPYTQIGELLVLFLSRTDDVLPLELDGWTTGPSCLKEHNGQRRCWKLQDCLSAAKSRQGTKFCTQFPRNHTGMDLATAVFYKTVTAEDFLAQGDNDDAMFHWRLPGYRAAWAVLVSIPNADNADPIRSTAGTSCDKSAVSVFPSVEGEAGDIVLLSMAFDDAASPQEFEKPSGTIRINHIHGHDEAGFLYGQRLNSSGSTPIFETRGLGGPKCKDELLSVVIRTLPTNNTDDKNSSPNSKNHNILPLLENNPCSGHN